MLREQGRLKEALGAWRACLQMEQAAHDWTNAAISTQNLSQTELLLGEIAAAVATAEKSVPLADRGDETLQMMVSRAAKADALHAAGEWERAEALFADAERRQREREPQFPLLYSFQCYQYCDLLLSRGRVAEALERAARP